MTTAMRIASILVVLGVLSLIGSNSMQAQPGPGAQAVPDLFKGTPQEQAACSPDAARFCSDDIPDNLKVLACLQEHRAKLRKACRKVLEDHGE